jgi:hypothetical protein
MASVYVPCKRIEWHEINQAERAPRSTGPRPAWEVRMYMLGSTRMATVCWERNSIRSYPKSDGRGGQVVGGHLQVRHHCRLNARRS